MPSDWQTLVKRHHGDMRAASTEYRSGRAAKLYTLKFGVKGQPTLTKAEEKAYPYGLYGPEVARWMSGAIADECRKACEEVLFDFDWDVSATSGSKGTTRVTFTSSDKKLQGADVKKLLTAWMKKRFPTVTLL